MWIAAVAQEQYLSDVHCWWATGKHIQHCSWSSTYQSAPDVTWMALILPAELPNSSDRNILCLWPDTVAGHWRWAPCSKLLSLVQGGLGQAAGKPLLHAGCREGGEGRAGGHPAIVLCKHVEDECTRTSSTLNKSVFFCLIGK